MRWGLSLRSVWMPSCLKHFTHIFLNETRFLCGFQIHMNYILINDHNRDHVYTSTNKHIAFRCQNQLWFCAIIPFQADWHISQVYINLYSILKKCFHGKHPSLKQNKISACHFKFSTTGPRTSLIFSLLKDLLLLL